MPRMRCTDRKLIRAVVKLASQQRLQLVPVDISIFDDLLYHYEVTLEKRWEVKVNGDRSSWIEGRTRRTALFCRKS